MNLVSTEVCFLNNCRKIEFKIGNFSEASGKKGEAYSSPEIFLGKSRASRWRIDFFPRGGTTEDNDGEFVSIFLRSLNTEAFCVDCKFSIKNFYGEEKFSRNFYKKFYADFDFGFLQFLKREILFKESEKFINKNELLVICDINVYEENKFILPQQPAGYTNNLMELLQSKQFADITLEVKNEMIKAHKLILAEHSPVLRQTLTNGKMKTLKFPEFEVETVKDMVEFLYFDHIVDMQNKVDAIYVIAKKFQLERLIKVCEKSFFHNLTLENAISTLLKASAEELEELESNTVNYIVENIIEIIAKPEWETEIVTKPRLLRLIFECWVRSLDDGFSKYRDSPVPHYLPMKLKGLIKEEKPEEGDVSSDVLSLFDKQMYTDVTFLIGENKINAHKSILCCRSQAFADMFSEQKDCKEPCKIEDTDLETFTEMLKFIYSGRVFNMENVALKLFEAAMKYNLPKLIKICEDYLQENATVENCTEILMIAKKYKAEQLDKDITAFLGKNILDVITTKDWPSTIEQHPKVLNDMFMNWINLRIVKKDKNRKRPIVSTHIDCSDSDSDTENVRNKVQKPNEAEQNVASIVHFFENSSIGAKI